ncbi:MAG: sulfatase-like hydrolase/transferase, partial [Mailhella sp.]|nr:sulfatase-like hydrolase/transferase [Mailhella sp.]
NNTLLWLCSDHGEPMGNGQWGHGIMEKCRPWPYEELVHIPLIIKAPGLPANKRVKSFVQDCDCAPTILDWLGLPIPKNMTGKSLLPLCRGEVEKVRDFAVAGYHNLSWSIITEDWSYIHWINKLEGENFRDAMGQIYATPDAAMIETGIDGLSSHGKTEKEAETPKDALEIYKDHVALDDAEQWTCNPGTRADVRGSDELYDRHNDPWQLNNVIDEYPEIASQLYTTLVNFLTSLD